MTNENKLKQMKKSSIWGITSLLIAMSFVMASCNTGANKGQKSEAVQIDKAEVENEVREFVYPLPTSFEIVEMLNKIEASYIFELTNSTDNASKYFTEKEKALNLGIYGGDLSYASTYNQKQETLNFMDASRALLEGLDLQGAVSEDLPEQIEANEDNKEVLVELITNSFYDTYDFLQRNNRAPVSALVMAGAWVEGLYIATHISEETFNSKEMIEIVLKQKDPLVKLMEILSDYKTEASVAETIDDLSELASIYASIETTAITQEQMTQIAEESLKVRSKFVSVED
jgi:predicted small secreted protein